MTEQERQKISKKDFSIITALLVAGSLAGAVIQKVEVSLLEELTTKNPEAFYVLMNLIKR